MVDIATLRPGDNVKIVDHRTCVFNQSGYMDSYLGQVVTVSEVFRNYGHGGHFFIKEDNRYLSPGATKKMKWYFTGEMVEYVVSDGDDDIKIDNSFLDDVLSACGGAS